MDVFSLVLRAGDELHGWGGIRVDPDGTWFEPSHVIPFGLDRAENQPRRWPHAVRLDSYVPPADIATTRDRGPLRDHATITGIWRDDSILATGSSSVPWVVSDPRADRPPQGRRSPLSSPELAAAAADLAPHKDEWTFAFASRWMDPEDRPHFSIGVCRVTEGMAAWAASHPAVQIHVRASLLPAGIDPVAAAGGWV